MHATSTAPNDTTATPTAMRARPALRDGAIHDALDALSRPRLLVDAARHGLSCYERRRDLRRMLRVAIPADARAALQKLIPIEADLERRRTTEGRSYVPTRHVDILIALMAEARDFKAQRPAEAPALRSA